MTTNVGLFNFFPSYVTSQVSAKISAAFVFVVVFFVILTLAEAWVSTTANVVVKVFFAVLTVTVYVLPASRFLDTVAAPQDTTEIDAPVVDVVTTDFLSLLISYVALST